MTDMDVRAAARELDVSERTLRRWLREGRLDAYRVGGRIRIPARAVRDARSPYQATDAVGTEMSERAAKVDASLTARRAAAAGQMDEIAARSRAGRSADDSSERMIRLLRDEGEARHG
ncbi:MAG TPA: helix-turn-helix domain-containing protein [Candidatus Limnocylindria bacterium]|nr:helix-turn-helix domain-containing protein [Candidatus Limnocylindria bacterium]